MNRLLAVLAVAALTLAGCMAEDPGDVASQESAVESAPAPGSEDMRVVRDACLAMCDVGGAACTHHCRPQDGSWCQDNCGGEQDICRGNCDAQYPDLTQAPAPGDENLRLVRDACERGCQARATAGNDICTASFNIDSVGWWLCSDHVFSGLGECATACHIIDGGGGDIGVPLTAPAPVATESAAEAPAPPEGENMSAIMFQACIHTCFNEMYGCGVFYCRVSSPNASNCSQCTDQVDSCYGTCDRIWNGSL